jgi:hypothetical protein
VTARAAACAAACLLLANSRGLAQTLPAGPVTALEGRLSVGGEVVATIGERDEAAYFNYTDYEHNVFRMVRLALSAAWRPFERVALVAEVRTEDFDYVRPYAAYVRVRPWRSVPLDIQAGRIPPAFGAFGRRAYYADNPLIGYPLAYQYLVALRSDAVPATADDLLRMRGRGWQLTYPIGSHEPAPGVPLVSGFRWDTGIEAHWSTRRLELTGAVTVGTLSEPRLPDNNDGPQVSGRIAVHPVVGLTLGSSVARGDWLSSSVKSLLPDPDRSYAQTTVGADAEYSRDHWLIRGELVWTRFDVPFAASGQVVPLDALGTWIEGRYRLTPRISVAARLDRLGFSKLDEALPVTWDAPVDRVEGDVSYYFQRNLVGRVAVQHDTRDGGRIRSRTYVAGQLAYWF